MIYLCIAWISSAKAAAVAKKLTKSNKSKKGTRIHTKVHFYRPQTLSLERKPKYARKSVPSKNQLDHGARGVVLAGIEFSNRLSSNLRVSRVAGDSFL